MSDRSSDIEYSEIIFKRLRNYFGKIECPLYFTKDYELAVAAILSDQCTDERVNSVTKELFEKYPTLDSFAKANLGDLEELIFPTGFFRDKAKLIKSIAQKILSDYNGKLPDTLIELTSLPGIDRKTANMLLNEVFNRSEGISVDAHVKRISNKLGLTTENLPENIEYDLMEKVDKKYWLRFSLYLTYLGRKHCKANRTECENCPLNDICPSSNLIK
ncbi:MAG: endonuclease III [Leptospiraceae bacterium]|nr:endonuclease III [Leptospiraceae bacterium]MCP5494256.1 endonuclease III [Leptospiraceae bacterium]